MSKMQPALCRLAECGNNIMPELLCLPESRKAVLGMTDRVLRYVSHKDVDLIIDILKVALKNTEGFHSGQVIAPSINRMIFELEDLKKRDMVQLVE